VRQLKLLGGASIETFEGPMTGRAVQRRRLALLALLATRRQSAMSRDVILATLWPDVGGERARAMLSDSVYRINNGFAADVIQSVGNELRLSSELLPSDVDAFDAAMADGRHEEAARIYGGPFLDGFHLSDSVEFEQWVERERARRAADYSAALEAVAEDAEATGRPLRAVTWWRKLAAHDRTNARVAMRLMTALDTAGERAAAIQYARIHASLMQSELELPPDPEVMRLAERLRDAPAPQALVVQAPVVSAPILTDVAPVQPNDSGPLTRHRGGRSLVLSVLVALNVVAAVHGFGTAVRKIDAAAARPGTSAIAVLPFTNMSDDRENEYFSDGVTEELIATLSRVDGVRVASRTSVFMYKGKAIDVREVARDLGVTRVLEGSVRRDHERVRITAQLIDATNGYEIWSVDFERNARDVFTTQKEIARAIATTLRPAEPAQLDPPATQGRLVSWTGPADQCLGVDRSWGSSGPVATLGELSGVRPH
jgi:TolB-like protein/DNA-binding SARP family transcriptional activator